MDPIEVEGPDGSIVEFPAGTTDADIQAAMAAQFPATGGAEGQNSPMEPSNLSRRPHNDSISYRNTFNGLTPAQIAEYQRRAEAGEGGPNFMPGTNQNPYYLPEGLNDAAIQELQEAGVTYIDREGRVQRKADDAYGFFVGAAQPVNNTLNWIENGLDQVGLGEGFGDFRAEHMASTTDEGLAEIEELARAAGYRPGRAGQFAGSVATTAPLALATRNPWLVGAAEGALTSNAEDAGGLLRDTAIGAVAGKGGDVLVRGLGAAIDPRIAPPTRRLVEQGVEVSPGQLMGGVAHRLEDASTGIPAIGDIPNASQRRAQESVATVAIQRPLTSIGVELPRNLNSVHEQIDFAQRAVGDAYDELIPQLDVRLDQQFAQEFNALRASARNMQGPQAEMFENLIRNEVAPRFNAAMGPANGRITGESFKELESILGREVRDFSSGLASPHDRRYAAAVRELQAQLRDMLTRGNPAHAERLTGINDAYRQLSVLEDAVNRAPAGARGRFTPQQLEQAARNADPSVRRRAAARGDALFQDLAEDAGEVMTRTVNDSGTATRGALTAGLGAAFLGQQLNIAVNPWAVGALALGALPYNRTGNRVFTAMMTQRPEFAGPIRDMLDRNSWMAAMGSAVNNQIDRNENRRGAMEANANADERARWTALEQQREQALGADLEGLY